jgi:hypothetical protein
MKVIASFFVVVAVVCGFAGLGTLSQATEGVGFVSAACLAAIFARLAQASHFQDQQIEKLEAIRLEAVKQSSKTLGV